MLAVCGSGWSAIRPAAAEPARTANQWAKVAEKPADKRGASTLLWLADSKQTVLLSGSTDGDSPTLPGAAIAGEGAVYRREPTG